jgi:hypothetical protein
MRLKPLLLILPVFFVLFVTGCAAGAINTMEEFPPSIAGFIVVNRIEYEMATGNYSWERKKGLITEAVQTDAASPNQIAEYYEAIMVDANSQLTIKVERNPQLSVYQWDENGKGNEITLPNDQFETPSDKGRHIYEVLAEWKNGEVSYTFVVEVE